jgi:hypothetical protein
MTDPHATTPPPPRTGPPPAPSTKSPGTPLRYSMRSLLILVTVVAVAAALLPYAGVRVTLFYIGLVALLFVGPVCLGTLALYSRGYKQTFFLGALAGSISSYFLSDMMLRYGGDLTALVVLFVVGLGSTGICGLAAIATRRFLERRGWHLPQQKSDKDSPR